MKYRLVVRPEVDADLLQAESWYEQQQPGLGREFLHAVRKKMAGLPRNPLLYRVGAGEMSANPSNMTHASHRRRPTHA